MSQKIIRLCDVHQAAGEEVDAHAYGFGLQMPGGRWTFAEVDLCEEHDLQYAAELGAFLDKFGAGIDLPVPKGTRWPGKRASATAAKAASSGSTAVAAGSQIAPTEEHKCPACGHVSVSRSGLRSHVGAYHEDTTLDQLEGAETPYHCRFCPKQFTRQQALTLHETKTHEEAVGETG